jgi:hypothetical protein
MLKRKIKVTGEPEEAPVRTELKLFIGDWQVVAMNVEAAVDNELVRLIQRLVTANCYDRIIESSIGLVFIYEYVNRSHWVQVSGKTEEEALKTLSQISFM